MMERHYIICILLCLCCVSMKAQQRHSDAIDDVLQYVPTATSLILRASGLKSDIPLKEALVSKCLTAITVAGTTYLLKHSINEWRPDHSDRRSFPSGHTAIAFSGATALHKEYGKHSVWISIGGYSLATFVAVDRMIKDRHHWYDVAAGAAIGTLGTELSYYISHRLFNNKNIHASISYNQVYLCVNLFNQ